MNKILAIIIFPFCWITLYIIRIIWEDIIKALLEIIVNLFIRASSGLFLLITWPFAILIDVFVGLGVTFLVALDISKGMFNREEHM